MNKRKRNRYLEALQRRREEAARPDPNETNETSEPSSETPPSRVLRERPPLLFPSKSRRPYWK